VEWYWQDKTEELGENLSQRYFVHDTSHLDWPGCEPGPPWCETGYWSKLAIRIQKRNQVRNQAAVETLLLALHYLVNQKNLMHACASAIYHVGGRLVSQAPVSYHDNQWTATTCHSVESMKWKSSSKSLSVKEVNSRIWLTVVSLSHCQQSKL
jgi:hypothetical protein